MISILIPVYNYKIVDLVTNLHKQLQLSNMPFEIICLDDDSDASYSKTNRSITNLEHVIYTIADKNKGRTQTRQSLALSAKYDWLLFLDADVIPKSEQFIQTYLDYLNSDYDALFGGFAYYDKRPEVDYVLRWKYGRTREQKPSKQRNETPYKVIISANFMIRKSLFVNINSNIEQNTYGLDNIFGAQLKNEKANIFHIDNEAYHLGIETNTTYLKKKEDSAITVLNHYKANKIKEHDNDLLKLFIKLNKFGFNYIFHLIYKLFGKALKKNLTGSNPSIKLLQLYRISFMCYKDYNS